MNREERKARTRLSVFARSLVFRLAFSHVLLALGAVLLAAVLSTLTMRGRFDRYVAESIDTRIELMVRAVATAYRADGVDSRDGGWNIDLLERLGIAALEDGFLLTVRDSSGRVLWDAMSHNAGLCSAMVASMSARMAGLGHDHAGAFSERAVTLAVGETAIEPAGPSSGMAVASLVIGYWGPVYYRDADLAFIAALNRGLAIAGIVAVLAAALAGVLSAAGLAAPVRAAAAAARTIATGNYRVRLPIQGTTELAELAAAMDSMASTLEEQEELRRRLVIDAAHELRTPLAALRVRLEGMVDGVLPGDQHTLRACINDILRLTNLATSLQGLASAEAAGMKPQPELLDLTQLVRTATEDFAAEARRKALSLRVSAPEPVMVLADRQLLLQVLHNLLSNALRYSHCGDSSVEVRTRLDGESAVVTVQDWGIGIPAEQLERIFERFYRVDPSRSRVTGGFGVGLAIARLAARACGGDITAMSAGLGKGSSFELRLPATAVASPVSG
jgi:signal transduction histidine kinase